MTEVKITDEMVKAATKAIIVQMQCYDFGHLRDDGNFVTTEVKINLLEARAKEAARAALSAALLPDVSGAEAACNACKGRGTEADWVGDDMRCVEVACSTCGGTGRATPPASDLREARNQAFREAANLIAEYQIVHTSSGDVLEPRGDGNKHGMAYATAVAALQTEGK